MSKKRKNIRKRRNGNLKARYCKGTNTNGDITHASIRSKPHRELKEKPHRAITAHTKTNKAEKNNLLMFSELLKRWQIANSVRLKGGTIAKYDHLIQMHILPKLGSMPVSEITSTLINNFLTDKSINGRLDGNGCLSAGYVRSISLIISSAISFGAEEGLCNAIHGRIGKPTVAKLDIVVIPLEKQRILENDIIAKMSPTHVGIMISLYTGLRIGEICALSWNDIDLTNRVITVKHTVSRVKSKNGETKTIIILDSPKTPSSKRLVPIPTQLYNVLFDYRKEHNNIFVVSDEQTFISPRTYDYRFHKVLKHCGIESFNYHALRHTFATRCIEAGVDVKSLSEVLGHANVAVTLNTYVHSSIEMKKAQLEKLSALPN